MATTTPRLLETIVLNTVQAVHADLTFVADLLTFTGQANQINFKTINLLAPYTYTAYAAGTNGVMTVGIGTVADNTAYMFTITKYYYQRPNAVIDANSLYDGTENYIITSGTGATATTVGDALAVAVAITNGTSAFATCADVAGTGTFTAAVATFTWAVTVKVLTGGGTAPVLTNSFSTPVVYPSGTNAEVVAARASSTGKTAPTAGLNFNRFSWYQYIPATEGSAFSNGQERELVEIRLYANTASANVAALKTQIDIENAGTDTASLYLRII